MKRRKSSNSSLGIFLLILLLGGGAVVGILAYQGKIELPWAKDLADKTTAASAPTNVPPPGTVPIPMSVRAIPAYTKIRREHLWDNKARSFGYFNYATASLDGAVKTKVGEVVGRVLRHDKLPGFIFAEEDFYPDGTREGLVAAIPPGKRSLRISTKQVSGLYELRPGDRFDIIAAYDGGENTDLNNIGLDKEIIGILKAKQGNSDFDNAFVHPVVQNGLVIQPVRARKELTSSQSLTGSKTQTVPVFEMVIGVTPEEANQLMAAFATKAQVTCVPRSGHPNDPIHNPMPVLAPQDPLAGMFGDGDEGGDGSGLHIIERFTGTSSIRKPVFGSTESSRPKSESEAIWKSAFSKRDKESKGH